MRTIVEKLDGLSKPRKKFVVRLVKTILMLRGRVNFTTLARYGGSGARAELAARLGCSPRTVIRDLRARPSDRVDAISDSKQRQRQMDLKRDGRNRLERAHQRANTGRHTITEGIRHGKPPKTPERKQDSYLVERGDHRGEG